MNLQLQLLCFVVATICYNAAFTEVFASVAYNNSSKCIAYKALATRFGPQLPAEGQMEYLMRVTPPNSCCATENPSAPRKISKTYIALLQRHNCSFVVEILHAQQAGHQTTFVCNVDREQGVTMMAGDKETKQIIKISLLFAGQLVSLHLQRTPQCKIVVHDVLPQKDYLDLNLENEMLQAILFIQDFWVIFKVVYKILAIFSVTVGMSWYRRACKLKLHVYKQGDKHETCVICLEDYQKGDHLKILPCSHAYHSTCIDTWFHTQSWKMTCPICKQVVNT